MRLREGLLVAVVAALVGGGSAAAQDVPRPAPELVAQVGTVPISAVEFDRWFALAAHSHFGRPMELVASEYVRCVAVKRHQRASRDWRPLSDGEPRARCRRDHRMPRRTAMRFLVQAEWIQQEAAARGVHAGPRRVDRLFEGQK